MFSKVNLAYIVLGAFFAQTSFAKKAKVYTTCLKPGQFALTFDDGPNPDTTPIALEVLEKYNIKATFFINAKNWSNLLEDPSAVECVKEAYAAGHDIGSHTFKHKDLFSAIEDDTLKENVDDMTDLIESIIGVKPAYFRPPSGNGGYVEKDPHKKEMSDMVQEYLGERGYSIIMWGTDTRDWQYKEDVDKVIETLNEQLADPNVSPKTNSFITLLHDVHPTTVNLVLPAVIEYVQSLGYTFVPLSKCIGVSPYQGVAFEEDDSNSQKLTNNDSNDANTKTSNAETQNNTETQNKDVNINDTGNQNNDATTNNTNAENNAESNTGTQGTQVNAGNNTGTTITSQTNNIVNNNSGASTLQYSLFLTVLSVFISLLF